MIGRRRRRGTHPQPNSRSLGPVRRKRATGLGMTKLHQAASPEREGAERVGREEWEGEAS
jgi:hypothetical protein